MALPVSTSPDSSASTASVSSASRNAWSRRARACTVSLNERVSAILRLTFHLAFHLAFLPAVVVPPSLPCCRDVLLLALLRPASQEDTDSFSVLPKIDTVAGAEIDLGFKDPRADALHVRSVAKRQPRHRCRDFRRRCWIKTNEPRRKRASALGIEILQHVHSLLVPYMLP